MTEGGSGPAEQLAVECFSELHRREVAAFNRRLGSREEGAEFPTVSGEGWLPHLPDRTLYQQYFVAVGKSGVVRGTYILKIQEYQIGDEIVSIGDFRLPISEGIIDKEYSWVAAELLHDCLRRNPLLYGLGMGGYDQPITKFLKAGRWKITTVPFFFKVVHPFHFLRHMELLRKSTLRRVLLDLGALTGIGVLGIKLIHAWRGRRRICEDTITVRLISEFGSWADALWSDRRTEYKMTAVRDAETLRILYPAHERKFLRIQVLREDQLVGWVVMLDTRFDDHKQFGQMRLGSIVDGFCALADAPAVVHAATTFLEDRGVDLVVTNQAHHVWCAAFGAAGFLPGPSNFLLGTSIPLTRLLKKLQIPDNEIHMTRGDGDGPIHL